MQRLPVVETGSYLTSRCLSRVSGKCWPLTSTTHFPHTAAGKAGVASHWGVSKIRCSWVTQSAAEVAWANCVCKNHIRLIQMSQSACRMNVDSGVGVVDGGGGAGGDVRPCLIVIQRETRQQTAPSSLARLPWGNEGTLAIGRFVCGLITVGLSNELYSLSLLKKIFSVFFYSSPTFVMRHPSKKQAIDETGLSHSPWACIHLRSMFLKRVSHFQLF